MKPAVRARVFVSGEVQGVFFRHQTRRRAESLGLAGWVRNLPDGRVQAVFEGGEKEVKAAVQWCKEGPPLARVTKVECEFEPPEGETGFHIR